MDSDGEFERDEFDAAFAKGHPGKARGSRPTIRRPSSAASSGIEVGPSRVRYERVKAVAPGIDVRASRIQISR